MKRIFWPFRREILVGIIFLFLALIFTYPVVLNPSKIIFGYSGDNFGNVWFFWWQKYATTNHLRFTPTSFFNAPQGYGINNDFSEVIWMSLGSLITNLSSEILAFNFLIFLGFVGAFVSVYILVLFLTKSRPAALITGLIYGLSPYHYWQATSHLSLSFTFWLPLFVLSLFYFDEKRNLRSSFFLALTFLLTMLTTFYYGFFAFLIGFSFFAYKYIFNFNGYFNKKTIALLIVSGGLIFVGSLPVVRGVLEARKNSSDPSVKLTFNRTLDELVALSARPWDYLIYPPNHPVFGRFNKPIYDFILSLGNDFKVRSAFLPERVIFLGFLNAALALFAILKSGPFRHKRSIVFLLVVFFITSMPPYFIIKNVTFYTPSYFLYNLFPFIRVYTRVGVLVLLFTCLLSGFTLKQIFLSSFKRGTKLFLGGLIALTIFFEFLPNFKAATDLRTMPAVYVWLANQSEDSIVAEYPKSFDLQTGLLFQTYHHKRLFNMPSSDPRSKIWDQVEQLNNPETYLILKQQSVRYVIHHLTDLTPNPYDDWRFFRFAKRPDQEEEAQTEQAGFKKVQDFPEAIVYEVI